MRPIQLLLAWLFMLAVPALATAAMPAAMPAAEQSPTAGPVFVAVEPCFIEPPADLGTAIEIDCGTVTVPQFHRAAAATDGAGQTRIKAAIKPTIKPTIKLAVMRLHARQDSGKVPLFMLAGGPGSSLLQPSTLRLFQPELLGGVLDHRDVIVMDQRGAGYSRPLLDCAAVYATVWTVTRRMWPPRPCGTTVAPVSASRSPPAKDGLLTSSPSSKITASEFGGVATAPGNRAPAYACDELVTKGPTP